MRIDKKFILIVLLIHLPIFGQQISKSIKLLDEVSKQMSDYKNFEFEFKYSLENSKENIRQETFGKIIISKNKYKLSIAELEQLFDGNNLYTIIPENKEITITDPDEEDNIMINPLDLLNIYKTGYELKWDIIQYVNNVPIQYVKLIPKKENTNINYLLLGINMETKHIYKLIEVGDQRTTTTLTIKNLITNITRAENFFKFDKLKYPDYYID
jgi:outer membrane lipoprotein-sorting protein